MTDSSAAERISAIGRIAILTNASEHNDDSHVEITTRDARALLDEHRAVQGEVQQLRALTAEQARTIQSRPFEHGYTSNLAEAGRYLHPRAYQICRDANAYGWVNGLPNEVMIEWTDDPQAAAAAVRQATAVLVAERAAQEAPHA